MTTVLEYYGFEPVKGEVGIEIEMEGYRLYPEDPMKDWITTGDGSLRGDESIEYVLRYPVLRKDVSNVLSNLRTTLARNDAELKPSERCGVHVHINCQTLTMEQVFDFVTTYIIFEDILTKWCGEGREGNLFCLRNKDAEGLLYALIQAKKNGDVRHITNNNYRYAAINLTSLRKYGSVEFRALQTPPDFYTIDLWVQLLLKIFDLSTTHGNPKELVEELSFMGPDNFAAKVFGDLYPHIHFEGIEDSLYDGVRRAQLLAYTPYAKSRTENKETLLGMAQQMVDRADPAPAPADQPEREPGANEILLNYILENDAEGRLRVVRRPED